MSRNIKQILKDKSNNYSEVEEAFYKATKKSLLFDSYLIEDQTPSQNTFSASVVIPAWNVEKTILPCLAALEQSSFNQKYPNKFQVIVTDDGSSDDTLKLLQDSNFNMNLTIIHQDHHWQGQTMNAGISAAEGDIIIEVDGDTILNYFALENLMSRHQFYKDALYTGFRSDTPENDARVKLDTIKEKGPDQYFDFTKDERIRFWDAGWPNNMCLASNHYKNIGNSKGLWMPKDDNENPAWILPDMVFGMLFSLPRDIFNKIGGFDDRFRGWGCDDGYVGAKAISEGVFIIPVYPATGLHISHPSRTENKPTEWIFNRKFFTDFINATNYDEHPDGIEKAKKRIKTIVKKTFDPHANSLQDDKKSKTALPMNEEQLICIGKYEQAYELLSKEKGNDDRYFFNLSRALLGLNHFEECITLLGKMLQERDSLPEDLLLQLVLAYASSGKYAKAKSVLEKIAEINPKYPELSYWLYREPQAHFRQGVRYFNQTFYDIALKCFEAALISDHKNSEIIGYREKCLTRISQK